MYVVQTVIEKTAKYLLTDGLVELDIRLKGKIVSLKDEIMLSVVSSDQSDFNSNVSSATSPRSGAYSPSSSYRTETQGERIEAASLFAELSLTELFEDSVILDIALKYAMESNKQ